MTRLAVIIWTTPIWMWWPTRSRRRDHGRTSTWHPNFNPHYPCFITSTLARSEVVYGRKGPMLFSSVLRGDRSAACHTLSESLRRETLDFGEAVVLSRDGIDGLLQLSESVTDLLLVCLWN